MALANGHDPPLHGTSDDNQPLLEHGRPGADSLEMSDARVEQGQDDHTSRAAEHPLEETKSGRRGDGEPRMSGGSSDSLSSDLELESIRRDDPLYSNGGGDVRNRAAWSAAKHGSWVDTGQEEDTMESFDREKEARRLGNKQFFEKTVINAILIALWYVLSIAMSVYNKWMFSPGNLDFHFPLFSTSVHMLVQFALASIVLFLFPRFRPQNGTLDKRDAEEALREREPQDPSKPIMTPWFYLTRIASCATVTGLDIGLGNTSLKFISLTFFTMVKSSTLGFVLGFAILFRLESPSWKIGGIIAVMTLGVILMVSGETAFDGVGFALLMAASFFSGLRWSLTQILLRRTPATSNPFSTLFFLTPVMFVVLFLLAIPVETFPALAGGLDDLARAQGLPLGMLIVLFPGCIAFCMTSAEFALLKRTSVVTLSVCGIFKEVLTITAAGFIFGDELTPINISGLLITIAAIAIYNYTRMRRMKRMEISKARGDNNATSSSPSDPSAPAAPAAAAHSSQPSDSSSSAAVAAEEQVPMLPPPPQSQSPSKRADTTITTITTSSSAAASRRYDDDGENDDEDGEDVVMIQGDRSHHHHDGDGDDDGDGDGDGPSLAPMREPVRAFFAPRDHQQNKKTNAGGYAAL